MPRGRFSIIPDDIFIHEFQKGGVSRTAKKFNISRRAVQLRRQKIEQRLGIILQLPMTSYGNSEQQYRPEPFPGRRTLAIVDGIVIVAGDAHYWPGYISVMHKALLYFLNKYRADKTLRCFVMNGDVMDFPQISRWPLINWEKQPTVKDEIENAIVRMHEVEEACGDVEKFWPLGNHDARFSMHIASKAPELAGVVGVHLKDHFPLWQPCYSVEINDGLNTTVIKHTFKGGLNAPKNNVDASGTHFITNHLHNAQVRLITKRYYTLYGVDTGCIADTYGPQFLYQQDNPRDWRQAFAVLTFKGGKLMLPELVLSVDSEHVQFRGEIIRIS